MEKVLTPAVMFQCTGDLLGPERRTSPSLSDQHSAAVTVGFLLFCFFF